MMAVWPVHQGAAVSRALADVIRVLKHANPHQQVIKDFAHLEEWDVVAHGGDNGKIGAPNTSKTAPQTRYKSTVAACCRALLSTPNRCRVLQSVAGVA